MYLGENIPAAPAEDFHVPRDLFLHLLRRAVGEHLLGVDPASPEDDLPAELPLQPLRIHSFRRDLNRVERVDADFDEVRDERMDGSAGVQHHPMAVLPDRLNDLRVPRLDELPVHVGGDEQRRLGSEIVRELHDVDVRGKTPENEIDHLEVPFQQAVEELVREDRIGRQVHVEVGHAADPGGKAERDFAQALEDQAVAAPVFPRLLLEPGDPPFRAGIGPLVRIQGLPERHAPERMPAHGVVLPVEDPSDAPLVEEQAVPLLPFRRFPEVEAPGIRSEMPEQPLIGDDDLLVHCDDRARIVRKAQYIHERLLDLPVHGRVVDPADIQRYPVGNTSLQYRRDPFPAGIHRAPPYHVPGQGSTRDSGCQHFIDTGRGG